MQGWGSCDLGSIPSAPTLFRRILILYLIMKKNIWLWVILAVIILQVIGFIGAYNKFVSLSKGIDGQWAQVEVQLQRRFDLVPNLVNSVKGVLKQEQSVFTAIAEARTKYGGAATVNNKVAAANQYESALSRLLVVMENYPQLRSTENVAQLMDELSGTENRISVERRRFNELTRNYNTAIAVFPGNIAAKIFGFKGKALFEASEAAQVVPQVDLNLE